jgi:hypothetical protein
MSELLSELCYSRSIVLHEIFGRFEQTDQEIVDLPRLYWSIVKGGFGLEDLIIETSVGPPLCTIWEEGCVKFPAHPLLVNYMD